MKINKLEIGLAALAFAAAAIVLALTAYTFITPKEALGASTQVPGVTLHTINPTENTQDFYTFFVATTSTATSTNAASTQDPGFLRVGGAKDVVFFFSRGDTKGTGNSGSSVFKVQVSPDNGQTWLDYTELGQIVNTSTADAFFTRVASVTVPAGTSTVQYAMEDISYYAVRCIAVRVTDGESTCKAVANY